MSTRCLPCGDVIMLGKVQELLNDILDDPFSCSSAFADDAA